MSLRQSPVLITSAWLDIQERRSEAVRDHRKVMGCVVFAFLDIAHLTSTRPLESFKIPRMLPYDDGYLFHLRQLP